jgi:hypothetical protein
MLMACLLPLSAGVLYFDDIPNNGEVPMPPSYGGFTWDSNFWIEPWSEFSNSSYGNTYQFPSMSNTVFNGSGVLGVTMSGSPFIFNGADFSGWDQNNGIGGYTATSVSVSGYLGGSLVGTAAINLPADTFVWLSANMGPVDELVISSSASGNWWLMDNFTYNQNTVPEPGSLLLCVAGLALAGTLKLRRR